MKPQTATIRLPNSSAARKQVQQPQKPQMHQRRSNQYPEPRRAQSRDQYQTNMPRDISPVPQAHPMESFYQGGLTNINMGSFPDDQNPISESTIEHGYFENNSEYHNPFNTQQQYMPRVQPQFKNIEYNPQQRNQKSPQRQPARGGGITTEQLNSMTVEQILAAANGSKRQNYAEIFEKTQQRQNVQQPYYTHNPQRYQQADQARYLQERQQSPKFMQPSQMNPSPSYENMIENKVFSMLNTYFQQAPNPIQAQPNTSFQSTQNPFQSTQPNAFQSTQPQNLQQLDEIKQTTSNLQSEISNMRKFIEDLSMSVTEKDAEIIKLKMHLGDERIKQQPTRATKQQQESALSIAEHDYQDLIEENSQLRQNLKEIKESHNQEIRHLQETMKNSVNGTDGHSQEQEQTILGLREDCFRMQDEVQKALKIHKANKVLQDKNSILKTEMERLKQEQKQVIDEKDVRIQTMQQQLTSLQAELTKVKHSVSSLNQVNPAETGKVIELQSKIEQLTIQFTQQQQGNVRGMEELRAQLQASQNERQKLQDQIFDLSSKQDSQSQGLLQQMKEESAQMEANYKQKLKQIEKEAQDGKQLLAQLQLTIAQNGEQLDQKEKKIKEADLKAEKAERQLNESKKQVDGLAQQINKDLEMISQLQVSEASLQKEIAQNKQVVTQLTTQIAMLASMGGGGKK